MFSFPVEAFTRKLCSIPLLAPHPLPCSRETHFWYIVTDEVNEPSLLNQYSKILSPSERRATLHLNGTKLQKAALLARTLVRTTLSRYTNCEITPESLKFDKNKYGKPQLVWQQEGWSPPCLNFNISHTSSLIACAVTIDLQVGIDVEDKQRTLKHGIISFAKRFFSPNEVQYLHAFADPVMQQQEFIKLWTLKVYTSAAPHEISTAMLHATKTKQEAYVKALGRGFSAAPFKNFAIRLEAKEGMENNAALPISMVKKVTL
ncbi:4'-phosphopantetheinyl transferase [Apostasia shenzhenica]|uniref:holo-[acyl-carrier-protein] synthase n=1 Tax=Apostasia shenzhenica TaxID=1088818 RepID=A0A2I0A8T1_9ASPA|nr:4'-phosphopantetheinyl transferase [Apostasia shenzhenica]